MYILMEAWAANQNIPDQYRNVLYINGDVSAVDREKFKQQFTDSPNHNVMIINNAGLESINLQASNVLIVATTPSSGGNLIQLAGRISRIGSAYANLYIRFLIIKDSQDEDEYLIIHQQMAFMAAIIGESEKGLIDWEHLKESDKDTSNKELDKDEYLQRSVAHLVLKKRAKRASGYFTKSKLTLL